MRQLRLADSLYEVIATTLLNGTLMPPMLSITVPLELSIPVTVPLMLVLVVTALPLASVAVTESV